jgi:hypothetical protein
VVKVIKSDFDALTIFVIDEPTYDTLIVYQQDKDEKWKKISEFPYQKDKISFTIKGLKNFIIEIDEGLYKVELVLNGAIVNSIVSPTMNTISVSWKRGIAKLKRHEFFIKAKKINGNKLLIFKKLGNREHCPQCWDEDLKSSNNTNCPLCGGTGYIEKYSQPFFTWGGPYMTQPSSVPLGNPEGKDKFNPNYGSMSSITLLPDIPINQFDLIYIIEAGELNIVKNITQTFFNNIIISQNATIASIPSTGREYRAIEPMLLEKLKEFNGA